jgi:hypothetical protein
MHSGFLAHIELVFSVVRDPVQKHTFGGLSRDHVPYVHAGNRSIDAQGRADEDWL